MMNSKAWKHLDDLKVVERPGFAGFGGVPLTFSGQEIAP
jgi:hypothetical protein